MKTYRQQKFSLIGAKASLVLVALSMVCTCAGCAGPTTPLGAPWATGSEQMRNGPLSFIASLFKIADGKDNKDAITSVRFIPERQVLHGPSPMTVLIDDLSGIKTNYKLVVRHNGIDVTKSFLRQARISRLDDNRQLMIQIPVVRLPAAQDHLIEVVYGSTSNLTAYARYEPPLCNAFREKMLLHTDRFNPDARLLGLIKKISKQTGFNPVFTAALIAQESGFNARTVSWARAIGLTQVTPVADEELTQTYGARYASWPRYPGLNELPSPLIRLLIMSGRANEDNEWRLDPERSIRGGLAYMHYLVERWSEPENMAKIRATFSNPTIAQTQLILASYNSGYARVAGALSRRGASWLSAPQLQEARKYVNRIFSYCEHFSLPEASHENET